MGKIVGIDLGTATSEVAYINAGTPEIIVNELGSRITPSVVGVTDDNEVIVGIAPRRQAVLKPEQTALEVKRQMGEDVLIPLGEAKYSPQQISSMLLKHLKECAEEFLGEEVTEAVITVPSNFNDLQRQATKEAGEMAGFKVERIINEPTAAALAYGINNLSSEQKILVYDLGGGTFDVTVLELFDGVLDIQNSRGNNKLGGKDFDQRIMDYIIEDFKEKEGIDLSKNVRALARIKEAAEAAKIELSGLESTQIIIPFIAMNKAQMPLEVNLKLTREKFEELISDLVSLTEVEIDKALEAAKYSVEDVDIVLAVGGSSRIPCIKNLLKNKFGDKVKVSINPDEAVALGAAIQAGIKNDEIGEKNILITDVCRYTLGTSVVDEVGGQLITGIFDPIIMKDSKIPCSAKKVYDTLSDGQTKVEVSVYQGDEKFVGENIKIGEFSLEGIPAGPAGKEQIEVEFAYNLNGILEVSATIVSTGKQATRIIDMMSKKDKANEKTTKTERKAHKHEKWEDCKLAAKVKDTIEIAEIRVEKLPKKDKEKVQRAIKKLKDAVVEGNEKLVEQYDEALTDLIFDLD